MSVQLRLAANQAAALHEMANAEKTPRSEIIRVAVAQHLKAKGYLTK